MLAVLLASGRSFGSGLLPEVWQSLVWDIVLFGFGAFCVILVGVRKENCISRARSGKARSTQKEKKKFQN